MHQWREGPFPGSLGPILLLPSRKPLTAGSPKTGGGGWFGLCLPTFRGVHHARLLILSQNCFNC